MTAALTWRKSSFSHEDGECVELAAANRTVALRESDDPEVVIATTPHTFGTLIRAIKAGSYDDLSSHR